MIEGITPISNGEIFHKLLNANVSFILTGSRFFGTATEKSDWDFFVGNHWWANGKEMTKFFMDLGFQVLHSSDYADVEIDMVYRYRVGAIQVDVQVVKDSDLKQKVQNRLYANPNFRRLYTATPKWDRSAFWDLAYAAVAQTQDSTPNHNYGYRLQTLTAKAVGGLRMKEALKEIPGMGH